MSDKEKEKLKRKAAKRAQMRKEGSEGTSDETSSSEGKKSRLPATILGAKYVRLLDKVISSLRSEVAHGNRKLFLDDVFVVYLLAFFNPIVRSLRTLEDLSKTRQAQKHLSVSAVCKSTLSDFNKIVEPERLHPILVALRETIQHQMPGKPHQDKGLELLLKQVIAVDGTFLPAMADVAWAVSNSNNHGTVKHRARIDARIDVRTWIPEAIVVPEPGESESDSARRHIEPNKIYLYDRGYSGLSLIRDHYEPENDTQERASNEVPNAKAHFVIRYKKEGSNTPKLKATKTAELTAKQRAAGIVSDRTGYFESEASKKEGISKILLREVVITFQEKGEDKVLRIITNLLDVSADTIGLLYRHRWQVELFFRWFKTIANFNHLISHSKNGTLSHLYVTIIGVMLMYLHTGNRPSKYMFALLGQVASGGATLDEIFPILQERERRNELDRQSAARRRAKKKS